MSVDDVFELFLVVVEEEYSMTLLQEVTSKAPTNSLSSLIVSESIDNFPGKYLPPETRICFCGGALTAGVETSRGSCAEVMVEVIYCDELRVRLSENHRIHDDFTSRDGR